MATAGESADSALPEQLSDLERTPALRHTSGN